MLKKQLENILEKYNLLKEFKTQEHFFVQIDNEVHDPIILKKEGHKITVIKYFEKNGLQIVNPKLIFEVKNGTWNPISGRGYLSKAKKKGKTAKDDKDIILNKKNLVELSSEFARTIKENNY